MDDLSTSTFHFMRYKFVFIVGLPLLILFTVLLILFFISTSKNFRKFTGKLQRQKPVIRGHDDPNPNTYDDQHTTLLEQNGDETMISNGIVPSENITDTFSNDLALEEKLTDIPLNTSRRSLAPLYSQSESPTNSINVTNDSVLPVENTDILSDVDFQNIPRHRIIVSNDKPADLSARQAIDEAEDKERHCLHGSDTNIYIKDFKQQQDKEAAARKDHISSEVPIDSESSEDESY